MPAVPRLSPVMPSSPSGLPALRTRRRAAPPRLFMKSRTGWAGEPIQRAPAGTFGHVTALRAEHGPGADRDVVGNAHLTTHHDEISDLRAP